MVVAVDARSLRAGRGIARATRRTLEALAAVAPSDERRLVVLGPEPVEAPDGAVLVADGRSQRATFLRAALTGRPSLEALSRADPDVCWIPAPAPVGVRGPSVLTVHDLSWVHRPRDFTRYERLWHRLGRLERLAARADRIACDSAATREDLHATWPGLDPERTAVVPLGVDDALPVGPERPVPRPYVLYVGPAEPRKGFDVLLEAWRRITPAPVDLVLAGSARPAELPPGVLALGRVDDARLHALYAHARAVILPSRIEGYGLPPLEAARHGTPSVVTDLPVFRETLGDGALFARPGDPETLADALEAVTGDDAVRDRLVAALPDPPTWTQTAEGLQRLLVEAARA